MSLKAGRVGVHPADVDPVNGHITPSSVDGYTKVQADDKFLSKSDASSTYETKSDAAALQPKTLAVPIHMLSGSKLTVESALGELAGDSTTFTSVGTVNTNSYLKKIGSLVILNAIINGVTVSLYDPIAEIPAGYRPVKDTAVVATVDDASPIRISVKADNGKLITTSALNNKNITINGIWSVI